MPNLDSLVQRVVEPGAQTVEQIFHRTHGITGRASHDDFQLTGAFMCSQRRHLSRPPNDAFNELAMRPHRPQQPLAPLRFRLRHQTVGGTMCHLYISIHFFRALGHPRHRCAIHTIIELPRTLANQVSNLPLDVASQIPSIRQSAKHNRQCLGRMRTLERCAQRPALLPIRTVGHPKAFARFDCRLDHLDRHSQLTRKPFHRKWLDLDVAQHAPITPDHLPPTNNIGPHGRRRDIRERLRARHPHNIERFLVHQRVMPHDCVHGLTFATTAHDANIPVAAGAGRAERTRTEQDHSIRVPGRNCGTCRSTKNFLIHLYGPVDDDRA